MSRIDNSDTSELYKLKMENPILEGDTWENMARAKAGEYPIVFRGEKEALYDNQKNFYEGLYWGGLKQAGAFAQVKEGVLLRLDLQEAKEAGIAFKDTGKEVEVFDRIPIDLIQRINLEAS